MLSEKFSGKIIQIINSTFIGGGVAEILEHMVPLLNQLGVDARWNVINGSEEFFEVTKKFHNALHGKRERVSAQDFALFSEVTERNLKEISFYGDILFIHDPQPVGLIAKKKEIGRKWLWRCHIDVSSPDKKVWSFLRRFIVDYDAAVFSAPNFAQQLPIRQFLVTPSIDPLGVIEAFEMVRKSIDCQLVLAGGTATDDPESEEVLEEVRKRAEDNPDVHILLVPPESDVDINALQRAATDRKSVV